MKMYCISWKKNAANKNSSVRKTKQNRLMLFSYCAVSGRKNQELHKVVFNNSNDI